MCFRPGGAAPARAAGDNRRLAIAHLAQKEVKAEADP